MTKPRVGIGNVAIKLNGSEYELVPTLAAAQGTSRMSGGIRGAIEAVLRLDVDVITRIIQLGLGPKVTKDLGPDLPELIWQTGMTDTEGELAAKCVEYLTMLSNGGRPLAPVEAHDDSGNPPKS